MNKIVEQHLYRDPELIKTVGQRQYRNPEEIIKRINNNINSYISSYKGDLSEDEQAIIDKVKAWDIKVERQIMEIFQNSISETEFDELLEYTLHSVVDVMKEQAKADGVITPHEERIIAFMSDHILKNGLKGD